jgi:hypothetical protein
LPEATSPIPARTPLRHALWLAGIFAALTFLIHFASSLWGSHLGYGFFRDELYFLVCGHHLAWGYVDQPPLVALQARLAETLFGLSPTGIRILSFLAAGVTVGLTGLLTWQLGGRRAAQVLAMMAALVCPVFLGTSNYLSMNSFEPCFWMGALLVVLRIAEGSASPRAWLLFGLLAGLGIENKHSTVFFLVALLIGLILSPQRRILWTKGCAAGVALLLLLALPNLLWQWVHHFPTYELLNGVAHTDKNTKLPPLTFLVTQVNMLLDRRPGLARLCPQGPPLAIRRAHLSGFSGDDDGDARQRLLRCADLSGALRRRRRSLRATHPARMAVDCLHGDSGLPALLHHRADRADDPSTGQVQRLHRSLRRQQGQDRKIYQPAAAVPLRPLRLAGDGGRLCRPLQRSAA